MTKRKGISLTTLFFGTVVLFWASSAAAQPIVRELLREKTVTIRVTPKAEPKRREIKQKFDLSARKADKPAPPKAPAVKTSDLDIMIQPNAAVKMTPLGRRAAPIQKIASNDGKAEFDKLLPGRYEILATLKDFIDQKGEVTIAPRDSSTLDFLLEPVKYQFNIKTNISEGEVRFAPAKLADGNSKGNSLTLEPEGNFCMVKIRQNTATIKGLEKGYYTIDIVPSANAPEYEAVSAAITPDDLVDEEDEQNVEVSQINLVYKISNQPFDASSWTNNDWGVLPTGWSLKSMLSTNGFSGVALPSNVQYRYYIDFELISDVRTLDRNTIGFAVRAIDEKNYYLIQIGGEKAAEKNRLTGYIVRDGVPKQLVSIIIPFESIINSKSYRVIIKGKKNVFDVFLDVRGKPEPLGQIIDRDNNFRKGAIGIAELNNSRFDIGTFIVNPLAAR